MNSKQETDIGAQKRGDKHEAGLEQKKPQKYFINSWVQPEREKYMRSSAAGAVGLKTDAQILFNMVRSVQR